MGFIDTSPAIPVLYNVVHAVGTYCPNHRDDTMLVQYLLVRFYENIEPRTAVPKGNMTVDGKCGPTTKNWIRAFQYDLMVLNHSICADGRVDRIRNTQNLEGAISKTCYTLAWLDWYVADLDPAGYAALPLLVPLSNPMNIPPPSVDIVKPTIPPPDIGGTATGGILGGLSNIPATGGV